MLAHQIFVGVAGEVEKQGVVRLLGQAFLDGLQASFVGDAPHFRQHGLRHAEAHQLAVLQVGKGTRRFGGCRQAGEGGEEVPQGAGDLVGYDGGDHGAADSGGLVLWSDGGIDWDGRQGYRTHHSEGLSFSWECAVDSAQSACDNAMCVGVRPTP